MARDLSCEHAPRQQTVEIARKKSHDHANKLKSRTVELRHHFAALAEWRDLRFLVSVATSKVMPKRDHHYYVYITASRTHVLYCGMTNSVRRRVEEHREAEIPGFTSKYRCNRLVWFEHYRYVHNAIDREKQIKRWGREKKIWLIEQMNPTWADLSEAWRTGTADLSTPLRSGRDDKS